MSIALGYLLLTGGVCAAVQVTRGAVRAAGQAARGNYREAVGEAIGGAIAPAAAVVQQIHELGNDICNSVTALVGGADADKQPATQA
jgi:hypothetical protein